MQARAAGRALLRLAPTLAAMGTTVLMASSADSRPGLTSGAAPQAPFQLIIAPLPIGGSVSGPGLACGSGGTACQTAPGGATAVTLTAAPAPGYAFAGWGGDCAGTALETTVEVDGPRTCSAVFASTGAPADGPPYSMTVVPTAGGRVRAAGIHCGIGDALCSVAVNRASTLGMVAEPSPGYTFRYWTGDCAGTSDSLWMWLAGPRTCSAVFTRTGGPVPVTYRLTINPIPTGGTVRWDGLTCGSGGTACQVTYAAPTSAMLSAVPDAGYTFTGWGGACSGTALTSEVQVDGVKTCSAAFAPTGGGPPVNGPPYSMTIAVPTGGTVRAAGIDCGGGALKCSLTLQGPATLGMEATPATGFVFGGWTGDCTGTAASLWVPLTGPRMCGAVFSPMGSVPVYQLTISPTPAGGTVNWGGLMCGTGGSACQVTFASATSATLTAVPDSGFTFTGWGGDCAGSLHTTTVEVNGIRTCSARFVASGGAPSVGPPYAMTVLPPAGGAVQGAGINCGLGGAACSVTMPAAMTLGLTATPASGYAFTGWTGDCLGNSRNLWVLLNGPRVCGAAFAPIGAPENQAPVITSTPGLTATVGQAYGYLVTATDGDGDALTYALTAAPPGMTIGAATGLVTWTPAAGQAGAQAVTVAVSDGRGGTATQSFTITVGTVPVENRAPQITSAPVTAATATEPYAYRVVATDADSDPLGFALTAAPAGMTIGSATGLVAWTPAPGQAGSHAVSVLVSDGRGGTARQSFTIAVANAPNEAPAVVIPPVPPVTLPATAAITASVTDDGQPQPSPTLVWEQIDGPGTATFSPANAATTTVGFSAPGTYTLRLTANDGALTGSASCTITVNEAANQTPVVTIAPIPPVILPATATAVATISDDGKPQPSPTLTWSKSSGPGDVTFASPAAATTGVTFGAAGTYVLSLSAFDGAATGSGTVTVTVMPPNEPPTVSAAGDASVVLPASAALRGIASDDGLTRALTYSWTKASGPGTVTFSAANALETTAAFGAAGTYVLRFTADDGEYQRSADVPVTAAAPASSNAAPVVGAGPDLAVTLPGTAALAGTATDDGKPAGSALDVTWLKVSGPGTVSFANAKEAATTAAFGEAGIYVLQLTASDGELVTADEVVVTVSAASAAGDRSPPVVSLTAPATALPGAQVDVRAEAVDGTGVSVLRLEIEGQAPVEVSGGSLSAVLDVPAVAAVGLTFRIVAIARDAAGNEGRAETFLTVTATPDTTPPEIRVRGPASAAPGQLVVLAAEASDAVGVASVVFLVDGATIFTDAAAPFQATYLVPADSAVGSTLAVTARAADAAGNLSESLLSILVSDAADTTPPVVSLTAAAETPPGALLTFAASASDGGGVALLTFAVDGAVIASLSDPPYQVQYQVPVALVPGMTLQVTAAATDFAGLSAAEAKTVTVVAPSASTAALVTGEVYDDATGLPLEGASVQLLGPAAAGAVTTLASSDRRGRYALTASAGTGVVRVSKDGWTSADRPVTAAAGQAMEALDARLTRVPSSGEAVTPALGATIGVGTARLVVSPGAVAGPVTLSLVPVGQQGLEGLLPYGWTPVAAADVMPHGVVFAGSALLRSASAWRLQEGTPLWLVRYDEAAQAWRAVAPAAAPPSGSPLESAIPAGGQYAWVIADASPVIPPEPTAGGLLGGVAAPALSAGVTATITPQPRIIFYAAGVHSDVTGRVTPAGDVSSGVRLSARVDESYTYYSGATIAPEPFLQDVVAFRVPGGAGVLDAEFVVTPSLAFEPLTLELGVIGVELYAPSAVPFAGSVVGAGGGSVSGPSGELLIVPPGSTADPSAVTLTTLPADQVGVPLPQGVAFAGAVQIALTSELLQGGVLSMAKPAGAAEGDAFLLVRLDEIGGRTRFVLAALGRIEGDRLVSYTIVDGRAVALEGVRKPGRYLFVKPAAPLGFADGIVKGAGNEPFAGALVSSDVLDVVSRSASTGAYFAAAPGGPVTLTALDLVKNDSGSAATFLSAGLVLPVTLQIAEQPPRVVSVAPANGARGVPLTDPVVVTFSEPIDPASVAGANLANVLLADPAGARVEGAAALSAGNTILTFRPVSALAANTRYTLTLSAAITDVSGYALTPAFTSYFDSLDTTPPPMPPAGTISASIPAGGLSTVAATQGTVSPTDAVYIKNLTTGISVPVPQALYQANGSFEFAVPASVTDRLQLRIVDEAGNETVVDLERFQQTNADGSLSVAVDGEGADIVGPGGAQVEVPPNAFPDGAVVTVKGLALAEIPVQLSGTDLERFAMQGALTLDFGGQVPARHVNVSIPADGDEPADTVWVVSRLVELRGETRMAVVDTAKLRDGRIWTASPPFPGVTGGGTYVFVQSKGPMGVAHGRVLSMPGSANFIEASLQRMSSDFGTIVAMLPFVVTSDYADAWGYPFPAGRVTLSQNRVRLRVEPTIVAPMHRELRVRNTVTSQVESYPIVPVDYRVQVAGEIDDGFDIRVRGPLGEHKVTVARLTSGAPDSVVIRLDADAIEVPVTQVYVKNLVSAAESTFDFPLPDVVASVPGGLGDAREVDLVQVSGEFWRLASSEYHVLPSLAGDTGNLVLRIAGGALTGGGEVKSLRLAGQGGFDLEVPFAPGALEQDFRWAFDGDAAQLYVLNVDYGSGSPIPIAIPAFTLSVTSVTTNQVTRTISAFVPPPDEPMDLGTVTDDPNVPYIVRGPSQTGAFDPLSPLTLTFSEPMDPASLKQFITLLDGQGRAVAGEVRVSGGNMVATFVPAQPLRMGRTYTLKVQGGTPATPAERAQGIVPAGAVDRGGNPVATTAITITTFAPRSIGSLAWTAAIKDVAIRRRKAGSTTTTTLFVTTGGPAENLLAIDATSPSQLIVVGRASAAASQQRITLLPEASFTDRTGQVFSGDLAVSTHFNVDSSSMVFWNVTNPAAPGVLSGKVLTLNPDFAGSVTTGAVLVNGFARGIAAVTTASGPVAYATVDQVGVMAGVVKNNVPQRAPGQRLSEPVFGGQFTDVVAHQGMLYAVSPAAGNAFAVLDPSLGLAGSTGVSFRSRRLRVVSGLQSDTNGDGLISSQEVFSLAVLAGDFGISVVDVRDAGAPAEISRIPIPGVVRDLEVDTATRRIFAGVDLSSGGPALMVIDLSRPALGAGSDADGDGYDDRVLWTRSYAPGVNGLRLDADRGLLYIAHPGGLDVWSVYDSCCDVGVDMAAPIESQPLGSSDDLYAKELAAIRHGIIMGLDRARSACQRFDVTRLRMHESGSSACLWGPDPAKNCGSNYQPGLSDHDISVFMPNDWYDEGALVPNPSKTSDPKDNRPSAITLAACTVDALSYPFTDVDDPDKRPREIDGFKFHDITFLPNFIEDFTSARYRLARTNPGEGDADNDLALGRQLLVMKHLTEAYGVKLQESDPGYKAEYANVGFTEADFTATMTKYRTETGIPLVEGHEWSNLMEFLMVKARALVRIAGSEDETSAFHHEFIHQLHVAGKAGIRSALAAMVARPASRDLVLRFKRDETDPAAGLYILRGPGANACLEYEREIDGTLKAPALYSKARACGSMEDYAASTAVRTLQVLDPADRPFTEDTVKEILRFYLVKSDEIQIRDAAEADRFLATVYRFIQDVQAKTLDYWSLYTSGLIEREAIDQTPDPDPPFPQNQDRLWRRRDNMAKKVSRLSEVGKVKLQVIPHVYNRSYRDVAGVDLAMYVAQPGQSASSLSCGTDENGASFCGIQLDLEGGDHAYPDFRLRADGSFERTSSNGKKIPYFLLKVDQSAIPANTLGHVAFTLDLPKRSLRESNRQNNLGGFYFYKLDTTGQTVLPAIPATVPVPAAAGGSQALEGDAGCLASPALSVNQVMSIGGQVLQSPVALFMGETATLTLTVTNASSLDATGVMACSTLTNECYPLGTIAAGTSASASVPFSSGVPLSAQSIPTVYSNETSLQTGSPFNVTVAWTGFDVRSLEPDPNPDQSTVMVGGTSYRHYAVVSTRTGRPAVGVPVVVAVTGARTGTATFTTDRNGIIGTPVTGGDDEGRRFDPGVAITIPAGTPMPADPPGPGGYPTATATVRFASVAGVALDPATAPRYDIVISPFTFTEALVSGYEASFSGKLFGGEATAGLGGSLSLRLDETARDPRPGKPVETDAFTVTRKNGLLGGIAFKPEAKASATVPIVGEVALSGPAGEIGFTGTVNYGDSHQFHWPLADSEKEPLTVLATHTLLGAMPVFRTTQKLLSFAAWVARDDESSWLNRPEVKSALGKAGLDSRYLEPWRVSHGFDAAFAIKEELTGFKLGFGRYDTAFVGGQQIINPDTSFTFAGINTGGTLSATVAVGVEDRALAQQASVSSRLAISASAEAGLKWEFLEGMLTEPWEKAAESIEKSKDSKLVKFVKKNALDSAKAKTFKVLGLEVLISPTEFSRKVSLSAEIQVGIVLDKANNLKPVEVSLTFQGEKPWGPGTKVSGRRYSLTYTVTSEEGIRQVLLNLASIGNILGPQRRVQGQAAGSDQDVGPSSVGEKLFNFVRLILENGTYRETVETGKALDIPLGLGAEVLGEGLKGKVSFTGDQGTSFPIERGVLKGGVQAKLESYADVVPPSAVDNLKNRLFESATSLVRSKLEAARSKLSEMATKLGQVVRQLKGLLRLNGTTEEAAATNMLAHAFERVPGPLPAVPYDPSDYSGQLGKPYYGVGGVYTLTPINMVLSAPAEFVVTYEEADLDGADESTLQLYRWNQARADWDLVASTLDAAANTVTATITAFGTYAVAPPMPAGEINWKVTGTAAGGSGGSPSTIVTLTSDPLTRNNGSTVPAGTVVHVLRTFPAGAFLTADALPGVDGLQIVTDADGRLHLQVELPGAPSGVAIDAFSDLGTIRGEVFVPIS